MNVRIEFLNIQYNIIFRQAVIYNRVRFSKILFSSFSDKLDLPNDEILQVGDEYSSSENIVRLLEEKSGSKVKVHDLEFQIDDDIASKLGQQSVSSNQVSKIVRTLYYLRLRF